MKLNVNKAFFVILCSYLIVLITELDGTNAILFAVVLLSIFEKEK